TALMATYLKVGHGQTLAAIVYAGSFLLLTLVFGAAYRHILFPKAYLLEPSLDRDRRRQIFARGVSGAVPYAVAVAGAPLSAYATLAICGAVAVFYALPAASGSGAAPHQD